MMRAALLGLLVISQLVAGGCSEETAAEIDVLPAVAAASAQSIDLVEEIRASGELKALYHTTIAAEIEGRVTEILVEEGGAVDAGGTVLEIDPARRQLDRDAARARLAQARANLVKEERQATRIRKLRSQGVSSEQALEEAETELLLARANVEAEQAAFGVAERQLLDASVGAPFAGFVARRSVQLGEFVQLGTALFELVSLTPLEVEFSVPELDANRIQVGQKVELTVSAYPDQSFESIVKFVSPTIDPATRTLRIRAQLANQDQLLRPGLFARVNMGISRREAVTMVPEESLIQQSGGAALFKVLPDHRVQRIVVTTGSLKSGLIEVQGDLRPGDLVVQRGHGGLTDGAMVRVLNASPQASTPAVAAGFDTASGAGL
jgi:membrane fusion protein (multidrug efflux system)